MLTNLNDIEAVGPFAFPFTIDPVRGGFGSSGMTLRDWFAGQAPVTLDDAAKACGYLSISSLNFPNEEHRARVWSTLTMLRYEYADAMLAARGNG